MMKLKISECKTRAKAYFDVAGIIIKLIHVTTASSLVTEFFQVFIRIPTPDCAFNRPHADCVDGILPFLTNLEGLERLRICCRQSRHPKFSKVDNQIFPKGHGWNLPISLKYGHLYVLWNLSELLFMNFQLKRLHLHLSHPYASKLCKLISRARTEEETT